MRHHDHDHDHIWNLEYSDIGYMHRRYRLLIRYRHDNVQIRYRPDIGKITSHPKNLEVTISWTIMKGTFNDIGTILVDRMTISGC